MRSNKDCDRQSRLPYKGTVRPIPSCQLAWMGIPLHSRWAVGAKPKVTWKSRIKLTLGYDASAPNGLDIAAQIRIRLENTGGLSVQLKPGVTDADLNLVDRKAWTATALAWLQPYLDAPLPTAASTVRTIETEFQATTDSGRANRLLAALQKQAAVDLIVLPISQSDEHVYLRRGVEMSEGSLALACSSGSSVSAMAEQAQLSGVRLGPLQAGERITLTDPKGRRHSVVLTEGGQFHTAKGAVNHDDLISRPEGSW